MNESAGRGPSARPWRLLAGLLAGVLITAALLLGALRFALALVPEHATRLQHWVEQQTRLRVEFAGIDARLRWFGPEIVLRDVRVLDENRTEALFEAREGAVALDLWSLFRTGELVAGRVRLVGPAVTIVRLADGRIRLLGQGERPQDRPPFELERLPAGRVEIEAATVSYRDLKTGRGPWTLEQVQLVLQREHDAVQLNGSGRLPDRLGSSIDFSGWLRGSLDRFADIDARLSIGVDRLVLAGLAEFLPAGATRPTSGEGPVSVVLRVAQGRLDQLRIDADLVDVVADLRPRDIPPIAVVEISRPYREPGASPLSMPLADKAFVDRPATASLREARYATLAGRLRLRRDGDLFTFNATGLKFRRASGEPMVEPAISGAWRGHPASAFGLHVYASRIDLGLLWPLVLATAPAGFDRWAGLQPTGEVRELRADLVRERAGSEPRFAVSADLLGVSTATQRAMAGDRRHHGDAVRHGRARPDRTASGRAVARLAAHVSRADRAVARHGRDGLATRRARLGARRAGDRAESSAGIRAGRLRVATRSRPALPGARARRPGRATRCSAGVPRAAGRPSQAAHDRLARPRVPVRAGEQWPRVLPRTGASFPVPQWRGRVRRERRRQRRAAGLLRRIRAAHGSRRHDRIPQCVAAGGRGHGQRRRAAAARCIARDRRPEGARARDRRAGVGGRRGSPRRAAGQPARAAARHAVHAGLRQRGRPTSICASSS